MTASSKIIPTHLLPIYLESIPNGLQNAFDALQDSEASTVDFSFYRSVASVFSSKIEGEEVELDSYLKHKKFGIHFSVDYTNKPDDLYNAYRFAQSNNLNSENVAIVHTLLSKHLLADSLQGVFRNQYTYVSSADGKMEYVAASPFELKQEMEKLFTDIALLL